MKEKRNEKIRFEFVRKLVFSNQAIADLASMAAFIAEVSDSEKPAERFRKRVLDSLSLLASFPASSPVFNPERDPDVHYRVIDSLTIVFYRYTDNEVVVEAVRDARSNWREEWLTK